MRGALMRGAALAALAWLAACAAKPPGMAPADSAAMPSAPAEAPAEEANVPMESLLHVRSSELRSRFGDPHAQRRDGGAIVWNYEADGLCRLNLVLQGVRGSATEVVHAQARMAAGGTEEACFERLRHEARVSPVPVEETVVAAPMAAPMRAPARVPAVARAAARPSHRAAVAPRPAAAARAPAARPPRTAAPTQPAARQAATQRRGI